MTMLEWVGAISIIIFAIELLIGLYYYKKPEKYTKDPNFNMRQREFNRMGEAFEKLTDLRDLNYDSHNEVINNIQSSLDYLVHSTVPLPKESFASDYKSKRVDYTVIYHLARAIINSEVKNISVSMDDLNINRQ